MQLEREKMDPMLDKNFMAEGLRVVREGLDCGNAVLALPEACRVGDVMKILNEYERDWFYTEGFGAHADEGEGEPDEFNPLDLALATDTRPLKWKQGPNGDRFDGAILITMAPMNTDEIGRSTSRVVGA